MDLVNALFGRWVVMIFQARMFLLLGLMASLMACTTIPVYDWQSQYGQEHPLAGSIWSLRGGQRINADLDDFQLSAAPRLLIGEVHDNPDHHRIQLHLIKELIRQGHYPALVFEQFDQDQQTLVDQYLHEDLQILAQKSRFSERGWDWAYYRPLLELAATYDLPVYAGNLSREKLKLLGQSKPPEQLSELLQIPLVEGGLDQLREDIRISHCNMVDKQMVDRMVHAQRLRDAGLARTLIEASEPAVLIAGNGHVRRDYGVGGILENREWQSVLSVGLIEVQSGMLRLEDYPELYNDGKRVFDIVIFTARAHDEDPCTRFRQQLQNMGHKP
jgi:uncharacterized iron-regulated protein